MDDQAHKTHRARSSGRKAEKKKLKEQKSNAKPTTNEAAKPKNPKAFTFKSAVRAARSAQRAANVVEKKTHIPLVDRTPVEPPPFIVGIIGPPKVGKSLLLQSLVKHHTRQNLTSVKGPVTLVTGKKRRVSFIECNNDINSMIDLAKVADLVLLLIDASYGFEMETFEFLHICQVHGMPRILGVLTHLDALKTAEKVKMAKKTLKHRFWTEVYQGAKLFYLSGLIHEQYLRNEVRNLARFISVMKLRPLQWRTTHPYLLIDRMEDITNPESIRTNHKSDRDVCVYGYMRGIPMKQNCSVHIAGMGDATVHHISYLPDPCPYPTEQKKRSLNEKERLVYAPFSGVGGVLFDKDAVYVDLGGPQTVNKQRQLVREAPTNEYISLLASSQLTLDDKMRASEVSLFKDSIPISYSVAEEDSDFGSGEEDSGSESEGDGENESGSDSDDESQNEMYQRAANEFQRRSDAQVNWNRIVYATKNIEDDIGPNDDSGEFGEGLFRRRAGAGNPDSVIPAFEDNMVFSAPHKSVGTHNSISELVASMCDCFVSGEWAEAEDAEKLLKKFSQNDTQKVNIDDSGDGSSDEDVFGEFEDLETGEKFAGDKSDDMKKDTSHDVEKQKLSKKSEKEQNESRLEKKRKLKQNFDAEYDESSKYYNDLKEDLSHQAQLNRSAFEHLDDSERVLLEGFRPGMYVRLELKSIVCEFVTNFDATYPCVVGGLLTGEDAIGCVQSRFLKHRWHAKILKNRDPVIVSMGWRRFQTLPIYSMQDHNMRNRMLKYTPEHLHCTATFWAPVTPPNTGLLVVRDAEQSRKAYRIAATGVVTNIDQSQQIMKKLKLIGTPLKVLKKTAFIKGMFNSSLEVAKFEGASIKAVSGIRGQIKKALKQPQGAFRASFEDKIQMKDIIFLRSWYPVDVPKFYTPVTSLLLPAEEKGKWRGMKTVGQLRYEMQLAVPQKLDSLYKPIVRVPFISEDLKISKQLQRNLPYADKPKEESEKINPKAPASKLENKYASGVILEPEESKMNELMKMLRTVHEHNVEKKKDAMHQRVSKFKKDQHKLQETRDRKMKDQKRRLCRIMNKLEKKRIDKQTGRRGKKK